MEIEEAGKIAFNNNRICFVSSFDLYTHGTVTGTLVYFCNWYTLSTPARSTNLSSKVEHLRAANDGGDTDAALPVRCTHAQAVHQADRIEAATPVFTEGAELESVLKSLPAGSLNKNTLRRIRERISAAEEEGVPLLVRLGDTGWFAVRDCTKFNRTVIGGWAHVKFYSSSGSRILIQCKVRMKIRSA